MLHDPEAYSDPEIYNPDRFLMRGPDGSVKLDPSVRDPRSSGVFGWGRRACPGRHMAYDTLWLAVATILAAFDITNAKDNDGNIIIPELTPVAGLVK